MPDILIIPTIVCTVVAAVVICALIISSDGGAR